MGWGRMLLLGNIGQQMDLDDQQRQIEDLQRQLARVRGQNPSGDVGGRVAQLEREVDELRLYIAALIQYLARSGALDQAAFAKLLDTIDRQDGTADGAYRGQI